jgi:hypothetical protein
LVVWRAFGGLIACLLTLGLLAGTAVATDTHSAAGLAKAKKSLLVLSDMPKGWKSSKSSNNNSPTPDAAQLATCLGVPLSVVNDNPPTVYSPDFESKNDLESVDDSVEVFPSTKAARADLATASSPKAPGCLNTNFNSAAVKSQLRSAFGAGSSIGAVDVTRTPASDYGPHTVNITIYLPVTSHGVTLNIETAEVGFVKGNEEQMVTLTGIQTTFPIALSRHLTALAYERL